jgi:DNA-directed RNA polymerase II subunit RPB1
MGSSQMNVPGEKSKWILRIQMDNEIMLDKNITMDDINFTLSNCYKDQIQCVYSDYNSDNLVFRVRMVEVAKNKKLTSPDQSDHIYMLKNFQDQLLQNVVIRGIKGINQVSLRKIKDNVFEKNGAYKKEDIWVVDTVGTNLLEILSLDFIDPTRTISNDIREVFNVYGIEAARQILLNELVEVVSFGGVYINYHNYSVLCDRMTFTSKMISISRFGINSDDTGPITKASFEETPEMFLQAARHAELDLMTGVSANIMCGQEGFYGTSCFQVFVDFNKMINSVKYNPVKEDDMIADAMSNAGESTLPQKLVDNNVAHINPQFTVNDDEDYNPGF